MAQMANTASHRLVYKVLDGQEIDLEAYLPSTPAKKDAGYPVSEYIPFFSVCGQGLMVATVIDIHGGAFMLGASGMVNKDQVEDCVGRGWVALVPNHRLCPQVNLLEGPMKDIRDLLAWIYDGGLQTKLDSLKGHEYKVDVDHVFAFGTSSGGTLALSLVSSDFALVFKCQGCC